MNLEQRRKVAALGFFDGVHKGHGALLSRVVQRAKELNAVPAAVTFDRHPSSLLQAEPVPLINRLEDRIWLMKQFYGIEEVIVAPFDQRMLHMPWQDFITEYLIAGQHVVHAVCGHDFHFGYRGEGNPQRLRDFCAGHSIGCDVIGKVEREGITVSSTYIRTLIADGDMERAAEFLGHPHILTGTVEHGKQLGRSIGTPTANLSIPEGVEAPAFGVYASRVITPDGKRRLAVTNVGVRPTVNDGDRVTVEPWILDFEGDLYGQPLRLEFYRRLRGERKFSGLEELRQAIRQNAAETRAYFAEREGDVLC